MAADEQQLGNADKTRTEETQAGELQRAWRGGVRLSETTKSCDNKRISQGLINQQNTLALLNIFKIVECTKKHTPVILKEYA